MPRTNDNASSSDSSPESNHRISIKAARKMLGMVGRNYSDADILEIIEALYGIAEEGFDLYQDIGRNSDRER